MVSTDSTTKGSKRSSAESHMTSLSPTPASRQVAPTPFESEPGTSSGEEDLEEEDEEAEIEDEEEEAEEEEDEEAEIEDEDEEEEAEEEDDEEAEIEDQEEEAEIEDQEEEAEEEDDCEEEARAWLIEEEGDGEMQEQVQDGPQSNEAVAVNQTQTVANPSGKRKTSDFTSSKMMEASTSFQDLSRLFPLSGPKADTLKRKWLDVEILEMKAFIQRLSVLKEEYSLYLSVLERRRDRH